MFLDFELCYLFHKNKLFDFTNKNISRKQDTRNKEQVSRKQGASYKILSF